MSSIERDKIRAQKQYFTDMCVYFGKKMARGEDFDFEAVSYLLELILGRLERMEDELLDSELNGAGS